MRLVRASRLYERWKTMITLSTGTMTIIRTALARPRRFALQSA
jgi:hypothetical protein